VISSPSRRRTLPLRWPLRRPRLRPRVILALVAVLALLGGGWLWFRDSSFVAVEQVTVTGQSGPDAAAIRAALTTAARNMTTLDVDMNQLRIAVSPYPAVKSLQVSTSFPHGMRIEVIEQLPVGVIQVAGRTMGVTADGTLVRNLPPGASLPSIALSVPPGGTKLTDPGSRAAVAALAAAPYQLLAKISQVQPGGAHGLVAQLKDGPQVYLGDSSSLGAKWSALVAVLGDPGSAGAAYIDVTNPRRPAAGVSAAAVRQAAAGASAGSGSGGSGSSGGTGSSGGSGGG
jgi:cell division protein FtsQ